MSISNSEKFREEVRQAAYQILQDSPLQERIRLQEIERQLEEKAERSRKSQKKE